MYGGELGGIVGGGGRLGGGLAAKMRRTFGSASPPLMYSRSLFDDTARPLGVSNLANAAGPSLTPCMPEPATSLTTPVDMISIRIFRLARSAMYNTSPPRVRARADGSAKVDTKAAPFAFPRCPEPARVVTKPVEI